MGCAHGVYAQLSLSTAVDLAQRNSTSVRAAQADLEKATNTLKETKDVYIPNLILGSSVGPPSIGFTFSQPSIASASMQSLAYSKSQGKYIEAAKAGVEAAVLSLKDAREQVAMDASSDYIELDGVTRELQAAGEQAGFVSRLVEIEQQRSDAGVDSHQDLLQAQLAVAQLKLNRIHLESRAGSLIAQLASLTGLPVASIVTETASIPAIPAVHADEAGAKPTAGVEAAQSQARARALQAKGDWISTTLWPQIGFGAQYNRDATSLNNYNYFFSTLHKFKADNFNAGFSIQIPIFDAAKKDKARESRAEALRASIEAEQAKRQGDVQIANLTGSIRELDALAEVASLKQKIAAEQLDAVRAQIQNGNGGGIDPGAPPQLTPKAEQQAHIDERQKYVDALDAGVNADKARLGLLRALGRINEWLRTLALPEAPAGAGVHP
jgi:outer membrane protein TolC